MSHSGHSTIPYPKIAYDTRPPTSRKHSVPQSGPPTQVPRQRRSRGLSESDMRGSEAHARQLQLQQQQQQQLLEHVAHGLQRLPHHHPAEKQHRSGDYDRSRRTSMSSHAYYSEYDNGSSDDTYYSSSGGGLSRAPTHSRTQSFSTHQASSIPSKGTPAPSLAPSSRRARSLFALIRRRLKELPHMPWLNNSAADDFSRPSSRPTTPGPRANPSHSWYQPPRSRTPGPVSQRPMMSPQYQGPTAPSFGRAPAPPPQLYLYPTGGQAPVPVQMVRNGHGSPAYYNNNSPQNAQYPAHAPRYYKYQD